MNPNVYILLFLLVCNLSSFARTNVDSLRKVAENEALASADRMDAMYILGRYYISMGPDSTQYFAEQQLALARAEGDARSEGRALQVMGTYHMRKLNDQEAMKVMYQGLSISLPIGDSVCVGKLLNQMASAYYRMGKLDSAATYYTRSMEWNQALGDQRWVASALGGLGLIAKDKGKLDLALSYYEQSLKILKEISFKTGLAQMYTNIAYIYILRNEYEEAAANCLNTYEIYKAERNLRSMAGSLNQLGMTYFYAEQYDKSLAYFEEGLRLQDSLGNEPGKGEFYGNMGMVYDVMGNSAQALEHYERSLAIKENHGDRRGVTVTTVNIGNLYKGQGDYESALDYYFEALEAYEEMDNQVMKTNLLNQIGIAYYLNEEDSLALQYSSQSLEMAKQLGLVEPEARALVAIADIHHESGQRQLAKTEFEKALQIGKTIGDITTLNASYTGLAKIAFRDKAWQRARDYAAKGLEYGQQTNNVRQIRNAAGILWKSQEALGQKAAAFDSYRLYIQMRDSVNSEENQRATIRYEFSQKALADSLRNANVLAVQVAENKRRQTTSYFLIGGLLITLIFGLILFNRFRLTRRQKNIIEAEKGKVDRAYLELNDANEKLKELDTFKSRFFTNISHEFRTPLTVITGMSRQVRQKPDEWLDKGMDLIDRNAQSLLNLINQILDLRKLEFGKMTLNNIQDDMIHFLRLQTGLFESLAETKGVALTFESSLESLQMDFDPEKVSQIHRNLVSNAIKFTPPGGTVTLSLDLPQTDHLRMRVADTGMGIPEEKQPLIFERFYQADNTDTREGEGTGIGLSLTKELVDLMEGDIQVLSEEGLGTTFTVLLPVSTQAPETRATASEAMAPVMPLPEIEAPLLKDSDAIAERPSLLIIEDNPDIVAYLYALLEEEYSLSSAPDGQAGIELALETVPDLIISDVMMPKKNGYQVTETLKLDERTSHIPIVLLTAKADLDSRLEGYKRGADAYLAKPFDHEELKIRLEKLWEIRQRLQARYQDGSPLPETEDPTEASEDVFITKVRDQIMEHIDDGEYRRDALCEDLGLSKSSLNRKLKALTNKSIGHFIRKVRLDYAKAMMLDQQDLQISEVAYASGFNDPAYFSRVFNEEHQISPLEWRAENLKS